MKKITLLTLVAITIFSCLPKQDIRQVDSPSILKTETKEVAIKDKIAYIRIDSLMSSYGMFIDLNDEFNKKGQLIQKTLQAREQSLQNQMRKLESTYQKGQYTRYQVEVKAKELEQEQQNLLQYRDTKLKELSEQESVMSAKISGVLTEFIKEYNEKNSYAIIFQTVGTNPILIADPKLDITKEVLTQLNEQYQKTLEE